MPGSTTCSSPTPSGHRRRRPVASATCMSDSRSASASTRSRAPRRSGGRSPGTTHPLDVLIELDSGGHRAGVRPDETVEVARAADRAGLRTIGVYTHGGHSVRRRGCVATAAADEVTAVSRGADALRAAGFEITVLSVGSTPTASLPAVAPVTEIRPGTYVYEDRNQVWLGSCAPDDIAFWVATTITSLAVPGQTVVDAGAKAFARDVNRSAPGLRPAADAAGRPPRGQRLPRVRRPDRARARPDRPGPAARPEPRLSGRRPSRRDDRRPRRPRRRHLAGRRSRTVAVNSADARSGHRSPARPQSSPVPARGIGLAIAERLAADGAAWSWPTSTATGPRGRGGPARRRLPAAPAPSWRSRRGLLGPGRRRAGRSPPASTGSADSTSSSPMPGSG